MGSVLLAKNSFLYTMLKWKNVPSVVKKKSTKSCRDSVKILMDNDLNFTNIFNIILILSYYMLCYVYHYYHPSGYDRTYYYYNVNNNFE